MPFTPSRAAAPSAPHKLARAVALALGALTFCAGFCASAQAAYTVVNGRVVVREGQLATIDLGPLIERHNALARRLAMTAA